MPKDMKNRNITIYICLYKFQRAFNVNVIVFIGIILKNKHTSLILSHAKL